MFQFAEQTELTKVQQELHATMNQLQAIRSELRGGIDILNPGSVVSSIFSLLLPPHQSPNLHRPKRSETNSLVYAASRLNSLEFNL